MICRRRWLFLIIVFTIMLMIMMFVINDVDWVDCRWWWWWRWLWWIEDRCIGDDNKFFISYENNKFSYDNDNIIEDDV